MARQPDAALTGPQEARVHIHALGRLQVQVAGTPLDVRAKGHTKPLELLKLLVALGGQGIASERLSEELWPDAEGDSAHGALTTTLYRLRKLIGADALSLADARLTLQHGHCWVDVWAFTEALQAAERSAASSDAESAWNHAQEALGLYRGPLLDGEFDLPDVLTAREKLHALFMRIVESLGAFFLGGDNGERAIALYRRGLECDELAEPFYRHLMACYRDAGRPGEAVALYQRCRQVLRHGAGSEPAPETTELYETIVAATPTRKAAARPGIDPADAPPSPAAEAVHDDRVRIAVLPFDNISGDSDQEYFVDGLTEDLITNLSKISRLSVTARNTVFTYKGKAVNVRQVGRELDVNHVLEGSVRKSGNRVRITAQLIDVSTGNHLWAERYDRKLHDIFEVQDEITHHIVEALTMGLLDGEQALVWRQSTQNPQVYDYFLQGRNRWLNTRTRQGMIQARRLFEQALALDGNFAPAVAALASMCIQEARYGWSQSPQASLSQGFELANRAIAMDDSLGWAWGILALYHLANKEHDQALLDAERGVSLNPDGANVNTYLARAQFFAGNHTQALATSRKAIALTPAPTSLQLITFGLHCLWTGRLEEARAALKKALERTPDALDVHVILAAAHAEQGQEREAKGEQQEILRLEPDFNLKEWVPRLFPFQHEIDSERMIFLLRIAGLPE